MTPDEIALLRKLNTDGYLSFTMADGWRLIWDGKAVQVAPVLVALLVSQGYVKVSENKTAARISKAGRAELMREAMPI